MFNIKTINNISPVGLDKLKALGCTVSEDMAEPDGIIVRSADMHSFAAPDSLLGVARAGAGYNNIPIDDYAERGIVVFNSPGANAEAVKEQTVCSMVMASRDVIGSIEWVKSIAGEGDRIPELVEKGKSNFAGPELMGKCVGVLGLGATGALVANACLALDMSVIGYDPFMSVDAAWRLSRDVERADDISEIFKKCDYISINIPYNEDTHHMLDAKAFGAMRDGVRIINESRAEVVDDDAMLAALESGKVAKYVTDFPNEKILGGKMSLRSRIWARALPRAKTAVRRWRQSSFMSISKRQHRKLREPALGKARAHGRLPSVRYPHNVPGMINRILDLITAKNINVEHMINKPRGRYAYTIIDLNDEIWEDTANTIRKMDDVLRVRVLF